MGNQQGMLMLADWSGKQCPGCHELPGTHILSKPSRHKLCILALCRKVADKLTICQIIDAKYLSTEVLRILSEGESLWFVPANEEVANILDGLPSNQSIDVCFLLRCQLDPSPSVHIKCVARNHCCNSFAGERSRAHPRAQPRGPPGPAEGPTRPTRGPPRPGPRPMPGRSPAQPGARFLEIWKSGNAGSKKSEKYKFSKSKSLLLKMSARSGFVVKKLLAPFGAISGQFFHEPKENPENHIFLFIFLGGPFGASQISFFAPTFGAWPPCLRPPRFRADA